MTGMDKPVRLKDMILTFFKIGTIGFGGGMGMLALIRRYLITEKKWITDDDLATAVALGQTIPGPFIPNYVEYIGFKLRGFRGLFFSVIAFLMPGFLAMVALSYLYFHTNNMFAINDVFIWIQPIIIGVLIWASCDMARLYWKNFRAVLIGIFAFLSSFFNISPIATIIICGMLGILFFLPRQQKILGLLPLFLFGTIGAFSVDRAGLVSAFLLFAEIGLVIFGGGFAAIPFIAKEVTILRPWLTNQELLTGIALSQITPGPVALLATFVGFKVSGLLGAFLTTVAIFLPSSVILILILLFYRFLKQRVKPRFFAYVQGFIYGIKPAIVGILIYATVSLAKNHNVIISETFLLSIIKIFLAVASFLLLIRAKISPAWLILSGILIGFILTKFFI